MWRGYTKPSDTLEKNLVSFVKDRVKLRQQPAYSVLVFVENALLQISGHQTFIIALLESFMIISFDLGVGLDLARLTDLLDLELLLLVDKHFLVGLQMQHLSYKVSHSDSA